MINEWNAVYKYHHENKKNWDWTICFLNKYKKVYVDWWMLILTKLHLWYQLDWKGTFWDGKYAFCVNSSLCTGCPTKKLFSFGASYPKEWNKIFKKSKKYLLHGLRKRIHSDD